MVNYSPAHPVAYTPGVAGKGKSGPTSGGYTPAKPKGDTSLYSPGVVTQGTRSTISSGGKLSAVTGQAEPNISLASGGVGVGVGSQIVSASKASPVQLGSQGAAVAAANAPVSVAFQSGIVERTVQVPGRTETGPGGSRTFAPTEVKALFFQSKTGDLFALPSNVGSKRSSLEARLIAAESKGKVTASTVGRTVQAVGLGGSGVVAEYKQLMEQTPQQEVQFASGESQPKSDVAAFFASASPETLKQFKQTPSGEYVYYKSGNLITPLPPGPASANDFGVNSKAVASRAAFESLSPLEKATVTAEATFFSPKSFELIGASVMGKSDESKTIIGEYVQQRQQQVQAANFNKQNAFEQTANVFVEGVKDTRTLAGSTAQGAALGYAIPAVTGIAGTAGAVGLTGLYSYKSAENMGASEADALKEGIVGGATAGAFSKVQALAATNPALAKGATQALSAGLLGVAGYFGGESAKAQGKDVQIGQIAGITQAGVFLVGAQAGGQFAKEHPFPIQTQTVRVPVGTQKVTQVDAAGKSTQVEVPTYKEAFKGLAFQTPGGRAYVIGGQSETGQFVVARQPTVEETPSIQQFKTLGPKGYVVLESGLEAGYYSQEPVLKAAGFNPEAVKATQAGIQIAYDVQGTKSAFTVKQLPESTKSAGKDVKLAVEFLKGKVQKYQGSYAQRSQQKPEFTNYEPADIDPILKTARADEAQKIAEGLKNYLNTKSVEGNTYAIDPSKPTLIVNKDTGVHAFDIHYQGQPLDYTLGAQPQSDKAFGININQPTVSIEGQPVQNLAEQTTRKLASAFTLRSQTTSENVPGPGPEVYRSKDIVDIYPNAETLYASQELAGGNVQAGRERLSTVMTYFTGTGQATQADFASRGLQFEYYPEGKPVTIVPLAPESSSAQFAKSSAFRLTLASASPKASSLKPSAYRQPASSSSSVSFASLSPSKSASVYRSVSLASPSPSSYRSSSPSQYPSQSAYKFSPSISPSSYRSPSPSTYGSASSSTYGYRFSIGLGSGLYGSSGGSSGFAPPKAFKGFGVKVKKIKGRISDLFSISLTEKATGRQSYVLPSSRRITSSKLFKRSGGFLSPTGEQLKGLGKTPSRLGRFF